MKQPEQNMKSLFINFTEAYLFLIILSHVIAYAAVDPVNRVEQIAYGLIMIKSINDQGDIFTHITGDVVIFCKKLRRLIDQVCSEQFVKHSCLMSLIKFLESVCKQSESRADINSACSSFLEERRNLKNCITGRNHIIDQDHIFALKVWTEEFVSCDRVTSVDSSWSNPDVCNTYPYQHQGYWQDRLRGSCFPHQG